MDWQQFISLAIVAGVALAFGWTRFKPRKFSLERDTHCGCSAPEKTAPRSTMVFRARRGERPQIVMKMR